MSKSLPNNVISNPRFDTWLNFETRGKVRVATGKVEIGQGITTALSQIAAEELDLECTLDDGELGDLFAEVAPVRILRLQRCAQE